MLGQYSSDNTAVGQSKACQRVQSHALDEYFGHLRFEQPHSECVSKDCLEPEHPRFRQTPFVIAAVALPGGASLLSNGAKVLVAGMAFGRCVAMPPDLRPAPGRNDRPCSFGVDRFVASACVVAAIAGHAGDLPVDLIEQMLEHFPVADIIAGDDRGNDLVGVRIDPQMHFPPCPPLGGPVLPDFPFSLAKELHPRLVDDHVDCRVALCGPEGDIQAFAPPRQRRVVRHIQLQTPSVSESTRSSLAPDAQPADRLP